MDDGQPSPIIKRTTKLKKSKNGKTEEEGDDEEVIPCTQQPERKKRLFGKAKKETSSTDIQLSHLAGYKDDCNISKNNTDKTDNIDNKQQKIGKKTDRIGSGALASLCGFKQWKRENKEEYEAFLKKQKKEEEEEESSP